MNKAPITCPKCGDKINHIPAGVSKKTGKPYGEFYACNNRECGYVWRPPSMEQQILDKLDDIETAIRIVNDNIEMVAKNLHK